MTEQKQTPNTNDAGNQATGNQQGARQAAAVGPLDAALASFPAPTWRSAAWSVILMMGAASVWAATVELDRIVVATGSVSPQGQVRIVQHLEGGVAEEILVREGDHVTRGQEIVRLDLGSGGLVTEEIEVRLDALRLERARLIAESRQIDLFLPEEEAGRQPDLAAAESETYRSRRREYESSLSVLRDQKLQKEFEVTSISARLQAAEAKAGPLKEQLEIAQHLIDRQLAPKTRGLALERDLKEIEGELAGLSSALPLAKTAHAESQQREMHERNRFRKVAAERLREVETEIARQVEQLNRARVRREHSVVVSPIDGVVKSLGVNTIGGVVSAGEPIAQIVPVDEELVIEARLSPTDIGHVSVGQSARVKLTTYDYLRYGALDGRVTQIAASSDLDQEGRPYFRMVVEPDAPHLEQNGRRYPISPGMEAMVDINLGKRSVASYLLEPVLKLNAEAFRDR